MFRSDCLFILWPYKLSAQCFWPFEFSAYRYTIAVLLRGRFLNLKHFWYIFLSYFLNGKGKFQRQYTKSCVLFFILQNVIQILSKKVYYFTKKCNLIDNFDDSHQILLTWNSHIIYNYFSFFLKIFVKLTISYNFKAFEVFGTTQLTVENIWNFTNLNNFLGNFMKMYTKNEFARTETMIIPK